MKISKLLGERVKETPSGVFSKSHAYLLRAGYIKPVGAGIFTLLPPAQRVSLKMQNIIRQEMDKVDGQEVLFPVVMPREIWDLSGRYSSIGNEMVRFKDRNNHDMLLGMTHEEAAVHACMNTVKSYTQFPFMIYQLQTKFRDEPRPRAGLIRVREFTMKDAYSFHETQEDLEQYYYRVFEAYERIYRRFGMKNFISIRGDNGMMGGKIAHEFSLLTDIGEDSIAVCPSCDYRANMEVAVGNIEENKVEGCASLEEVFTGNKKSIEEVCEELKIEKNKTVKAVCFAVIGTNDIVVAFARGDREVNECKLSKVIGKEVAITDLTGTGLVKGNIGPIGLDESKLKIVYDNSLKNLSGAVCGANKDEYHLKNVKFGRDITPNCYYDITKTESGDKCVHCGSPLKICRGIEIGNIFQLGTRYTEAMNYKVQMSNGKFEYPIMGCYGIGVGRSLASVAEEWADDKGLVWPMTIAPWHVYLCPIKYNEEEVQKVTNSMLEDFEKAGIEVILDDRNANPGIKFAESELMGVPIRVVVSPKSLANGEAEVLDRKSLTTEFVKIDKLKDYLLNKIKSEIEKISC